MNDLFPALCETCIKKMKEVCCYSDKANQLYNKQCLLLSFAKGARIITSYEMLCGEARIICVGGRQKGKRHGRHSREDAVILREERQRGKTK